MKNLLTLCCACFLLAGCGKSTRCDSQYMRNQMKDRFIEDIARGMPSAGIDLIAAGVLADLTFDEIQTDSNGGNGNGAVCRAKIKLKIDDTPFEDEFDYQVSTQDGDDQFRKYSEWPFRELNALLRKGKVGALLEKERDIRTLRSDISAQTTEKQRLSQVADFADIFDKVIARLDVLYDRAPERGNPTGTRLRIKRVTLHLMNDSTETVQALGMSMPSDALGPSLNPMLEVRLDSPLNPGLSVAQDVTQLASWPVNPSQLAVQGIEQSVLATLRTHQDTYSRADMPAVGKRTLSMNMEPHIAWQKQKLERTERDVEILRQGFAGKAGKQIR